MNVSSNIRYSSIFMIITILFRKELFTPSTVKLQDKIDIFFKPYNNTILVGDHLDYSDEEREESEQREVELLQEKEDKSNANRWKAIQSKYETIKVLPIEFILQADHNVRLF